jgi:hypothetical protein
MCYREAKTTKKKKPKKDFALVRVRVRGEERGWEGEGVQNRIRSSYVGWERVTPEPEPETHGASSVRLFVGSLSENC